MAIDSAEKRRAMLCFASEPYSLVEHTVDGSIPQSDRYARLGLLGDFGDATLPQNFGYPFISLRLRMVDKLVKVAKMASSVISRLLRDY